MVERRHSFAVVSAWAFFLGTIRHVWAFCADTSRRQCRIGKGRCRLRENIQCRQRSTISTTVTDQRLRRYTVGGARAPSVGVRKPAENRSPRGFLKGRSTYEKPQRENIEKMRPPERTGWCSCQMCIFRYGYVFLLRGPSQGVLRLSPWLFASTAHGSTNARNKTSTFHHHERAGTRSGPTSRRKGRARAAARSSRASGSRQKTARGCGARSCASRPRMGPGR